MSLENDTRESSMSSSCKQLGYWWHSNRTEFTLKLQQILIAQLIVFEKIVVMPKGQQKKIKGAICNVPVECDQTCSILPWRPESSGIILQKLKRNCSSKDMFILKQ